MSPSSDVGGAEEVLFDVMHHIQTRGFVCALAYGYGAGESSEMVTRAEHLHIQTFAFPRFRQSLSAFPRLLRIGRQFAPDLIYANTASATKYAVGLLYILPRSALLAHLHDPLPDQLSRVEDLAFRLVRRRTARSSAVLTTGEVLKSASSHLGTVNCVVVPPHIASPARVKESGEATRALRQKYHISGEATIIGIFGRLHPSKGHDILLKAALTLVDEYPNAVYVHVGGTDFGASQCYEAYLRRLASKLPTGKVTFTGRIVLEDKERLMGMADIVVHPAIREPFGLAVGEACLAGRAVIASNLPGPASIIVDGRTGLLVPPGDPTSLAAALAVLLKDSRLRRALGAAASEDVAHRFGVEQTLRPIERVIESMTSNVTWQRKLGLLALSNERRRTLCESMRSRLDRVRTHITRVSSASRPVQLFARWAQYNVEQMFGERFANRERIVRYRDGLRLRLSAADAMERTIYLYGDHEPWIARFLMRELSEGDVAIDVGANIGVHALVMGQRVGPHGRVFAFEPRPKTVARLQRNLELNGLGAVVQVVPAAASREAGLARLWTAGDDEAAATASLDSEWRANRETSALVAVVTLDDAIGDLSIDRLRLVKIDVEGFEPEVLDGFQEGLSKFKPIVIFEANRIRQIDNHWESPVFDRLEQQGYRFYVFMSRGTLRPLTAADTEGDPTSIAEPYEIPLTLAALHPHGEQQRHSD